MNRGWQTHVIGSCLALVVAGSLLGCGGPAPSKTKVESEVKRLGIAFLKFQSTHQGKTPADRKELEKFIEAMPAGERAGIYIEETIDIFTSSRDGADLVVRYGIVIPPPMKDHTVVAYEAIGVKGKHMVVYETGGIEEVTADRLKELVPDAKLTPAP